VTAEPGRYVGYREVNIEQGDTLESNNLVTGIVTSIVGIWQYRISFAGEQNHAGTTRMCTRKDAGLALAKLCVAIDERLIGRHSGPHNVRVPSLGEEDRRKARKTGETARVSATMGALHPGAREGRSP
jgi:acetylornithine deacetylase/succinyl-diaminopimelate desuccinylase-like protein